MSPSEEGVVHTHIGGQALLEGVMMRGKMNWAVAVRTTSGAIHLEAHDLPQHPRGGWRSWPVGRGMWAMYETFSLALKAFSISARYADAEAVAPSQPPSQSPSAEQVPDTQQSAGQPADTQPSAGQPAGEQPAAAETQADEDEGDGLSSAEVGLAIAMGIALAVGVFIVLPAVVTNLVVGNAIDRPLLWNLVDGVFRLAVFFAYIWAVGFVPGVGRVFAYHGAEHKTIHAFEHQVPLEPRSVDRYGTLHVRCGTSFLLMVMVVAIIVFSLVPGRAILGAWGVTQPFFVVLFNIAVRILLLPVVAGLAYEVTVKWAGQRPDNPLVRILLWPGLQLQRLTTREPDEKMIEVAIAALRAVAEREPDATVVAPSEPVS